MISTFANNAQLKEKVDEGCCCYSNLFYRPIEMRGNIDIRHHRIIKWREDFKYETYLYLVIANLRLKTFIFDILPKMKLFSRALIKRYVLAHRKI